MILREAKERLTKETKDDLAEKSSSLQMLDESFHSSFSERTYLVLSLFYSREVKIYFFAFGNSLLLLRL